MTAEGTNHDCVAARSTAGLGLDSLTLFCLYIFRRLVIWINVEMPAFFERATPTANFFLERRKRFLISARRAVQKTSDSMLIYLKLWDVLEGWQEVKDPC